MIPPEYIPAIAQRLKTLQGPVKIDYFHQTDGALIVPGRQPCPGCAPALELLQELAALHDELELRVHDFHGERAAADKWGAERVPGLVIHGEVNRPLRFYGVPAGAYLSMLLDVIVGASAKASAKPAPPPQELTALVKKLRARVHLRVVGSFQHPDSARAAATAFALALLSDKIDASVFAIEDCQDVAMQLQLTRIPLTLVNDRHGFPGVTTSQGLAQFCLDVQSKPEETPLPPIDPASIAGIKPPQPPPPPSAPRQGPAGLDPRGRGPGPGGPRRPGPGGPGPGGRGPGRPGPGGPGPMRRGPSGPPERRTRGGLILPGQ